MTISLRHRLALAATLVTPLVFAQASAEPGAHGEIRFRGAIVEAAQCQTEQVVRRPSAPANLTIRCARDTMQSRVTATLETVDHTAQNGRFVWSRSASPGGRIWLRQASETENLYRVTLSYL
ncbi:MAG: hypothetical protein ACN6O8_14445 [Achromobacter sp.]|uniref:hypothetical protein n=1 Tax=Achromobacter sp. TaxID=134375 RepID=UPI003D08D64C